MSIGTPFSYAEFPAATRPDWLALVEKTLAGASFESALVSRTDDGIGVQPIEARASGATSSPRARPDRPWAVLQRIDDTDPDRAAVQVKDDLEHGATGLSLVFAGAPNAFGYGLPASEAALEAVLKDVPLNRAHVRIDVHPASRAMADWLVGLLGKRRADPSKLSLCFGIDPAAIFAGTGRLRMSIEALKASMPQSLAHFFGLGVPGILLEADGRVYHNAGATEAQELGAMLSAALTHLRLFQDARQALVYAAPHIGFALSVDQDQFLSMAKIRALRRLWAKVRQDCAIPPSPATIHAETSWRMLTAKDCETNILRNTIAAFAAAAGGADTLAVIPHTIPHGLPDASARRIARNTQLVMMGESHLDFVADPGCGSGSLEALTEALCEAAWSEFRQLEAEGGILDSLLAGHIQGRIVAARDERAKSYVDGARQLVGTTLYPPAAERPVSVLEASIRPLPTDGTVFCQRLDPARIDQSIGAEK